MHTPGDSGSIRGGPRKVQVSANSKNGAVHRERRASGGITLKAGGEFLWPPADAHLEENCTFPYS